MTRKQPIVTAKDLAEHLLELGERPLCQIITVRASIGQSDPKDLYFNQLDIFDWNVDDEELEIIL